MRTLTLAGALTLALGGSALAANARHPYSNLDPRLDHGGDTGDSRVEMLNQQQLDAARSANRTVVEYPGIGGPVYRPGLPPPPAPTYAAPPQPYGMGY